MDSVGAMLSTANVELGPAVPAWFPTESDAVFPPMEIPNVPSPEIELIVTVRVAVPLLARCVLEDPKVGAVVLPVDRSPEEKDLGHAVGGGGAGIGCAHRDPGL